MTTDEDAILHEPTTEAFACFRLELHRPTLEGDTSAKNAWALLRETSRALQQAAQHAMRDVVVAVGDLRAAGKTRFATPTERADEKLGIPLAVECYSNDDINGLGVSINAAFKASGTSEYVYSSVARKLLTSELSSARLKDLLRGDRTYPDISRIGIMMRSRNWRLTTETRVANGKTYEDVVVEIGALKPRTGKVRLVCKSLHGPKLSRSRNLLKALEEMGLATSSESGWSKGALTIRPLRRPGQAEKWEILLPYSSPRVNSAKSSTSIAVHRSVANMLTAVCSDGSVHHFSGRDVVLLKHQMYARRKTVQRDISANPHRGRGAKRHFKALRRLADQEARATQTHLWRAARWVQGLVETKGAAHVVIDNFRSFDPDQPGPPWEPYVRNWPWANLLGKVIDAITRRAGVQIEERSCLYISQRCPDCGEVSPANIVKTPVVRGVDVERGLFKCVKCGYRGDVDHVAALNLGAHLGFRPPGRVAKTG